MKNHGLTNWKGEIEKPTVESFFAARDYSGALTLIDFETRIKGKSDVNEQKWAALAHIRLMNYSEAMKIYEKLVEKSDADPSLYCYLGQVTIFLWVNTSYSRKNGSNFWTEKSGMLFLPWNVQKGRGYDSTSTTLITTK